MKGWSLKQSSNSKNEIQFRLVHGSTVDAIKKRENFVKTNNLFRVDSYEENVGGIVHGVPPRDVMCNESNTCKR